MPHTSPRDGFTACLRGLFTTRRNPHPKRERLRLIRPAIDSRDGHCVRLRQGLMDDTSVFAYDPHPRARHRVAPSCCRLPLVGLNGALHTTPVNGGVVAASAKGYPTL